MYCWERTIMDTCTLCVGNVVPTWLLCFVCRLSSSSSPFPSELSAASPPLKRSFRPIQGNRPIDNYGQEKCHRPAFDINGLRSLNNSHAHPSQPCNYPRSRPNTPIHGGRSTPLISADSKIVTVTNLDFNITPGEWQRLLTAEFSKHVKVSNACQGLSPFFKTCNPAEHY